MKLPEDAALSAARNYEVNMVVPVMTPCAAILLEYVRPERGAYLIDVAAGTGIVARLAAQLVGPHGRVVAVDSSTAMLQVGREQAKDAGSLIEWKEGQAEELPLPDAAGDLVLCQHGLQYFGDRQRALGELRRVLRPEGVLGLCVWDALEHNPLPNLVWTTIARHLDVEPALLTLPYSCGDTVYLRALLDDVAVRDVRFYTRSFLARQPYPVTFIEGLIAGARKMLPRLDAMGDEQRSELAHAVEAELRPMLAEFLQGEFLVSPLSLHIVVASAT